MMHIDNPDMISYDLCIRTVAGHYLPIGGHPVKTIEEARKRVEEEQHWSKEFWGEPFHYGIRKIYCGDICSIVEEY